LIGAVALPTVTRGRHDQHRPPSVLGDLVREAPVEDLLQPAQSSRSDHDHGRVQLAGDIDDALQVGAAWRGPSSVAAEAIARPASGDSS